MSSEKTPVKLLAFSGSLRKGSYNHQVVKIAAAGAEKAGASVTLINLRDFPMPLYDEDLETQSGLPENAKKLKALFKSHDGLLIASPEYNSAFSGALKNAIDWASRPEEGEPPLACFSGKVAALMSASPGGLGGLRGLAALRTLLGNINILLIPDQVAVSQAFEAFDENGQLKNAQQQASVEGLGAKATRLAQQIKA